MEEVVVPFRIYGQLTAVPNKIPVYIFEINWSHYPIYSGKTKQLYYVSDLRAGNVHICGFGGLFFCDI